MFMRVNLKCAHHLRPPLRASHSSVTFDNQRLCLIRCSKEVATCHPNGRAGLRVEQFGRWVRVGGSTRRYGARSETAAGHHDEYDA